MKTCKSLWRIFHLFFEIEGSPAKCEKRYLNFPNYAQCYHSETVTAVKTSKYTALLCKYRIDLGSGTDLCQPAALSRCKRPGGDGPRCKHPFGPPGGHAFHSYSPIRVICFFNECQNSPKKFCSSFCLDLLINYFFSQRCELHSASRS